MTAHVVHWIKRLGVVDGQVAQARDGQLLEQFLGNNKEPAFAAIVRRHGSLVLSVCQRVLGHVQDAEDAFQATFPVLARRAKSVRKVDSLAAWLHGVAFRLAKKMKTASFRRRQRERASAPPSPSGTSPDVSVRELWAILHEELSRLPEKERQPLLLCYLEGLTQEEAAAQLDCPRGTLKRRLERGRHRLRAVLQRRGVALGGVAIPLLTSLPADAAAVVPAALKHTTLQAGVLAGAGKALPAALVSKQVLGPVQGALRTMMLSKLRILIVGMLGLILGGGAGAWLYAYQTDDASGNATAERRDPGAPAAPKNGNGGAAPKGKEPAKDSSDADLLRGAWRIVRGESSGLDLPQAGVEIMRLTFKAALSEKTLDPPA